MRHLLPIGVLVVVVGALATVKVTQISSLVKAGKAAEKAGPPPESVSTAVATTQVWPSTLSAVGSVATRRGVSVSNDATGIVTRIRFESGAHVKQGQVLVELDPSVEMAQLASARARKELALTTANRSRELLKTQAIPPAQVDADDAQLKTSTTDVAAIEAQIDRKVVRAPFAGRLGIRNVNLGQYLSAGTAVTVVEAAGAVFVDFTLPQQNLPDVKVGVPVDVSIGGADRVTAEGSIAAIDPAVDATTRTVKVRALVPNKEETLRPGMFVNVSVVLPRDKPTVAIPATAVVHASYGDSVFIVEEAKGDGGALRGPDGTAVKTARQQFLRVGETRGDFISVLDGVTAGQEVVSAGAFKLHKGSTVTVVPDVKPPPQLNPHPPNR